MERLRNQIMAEINRLQGELAAIAIKKVENNTPLFIEECLNLIDGVGEGFVGSDWFAPKRYYSQIEGVKNLRFGGHCENFDYIIDRIVVKVVDRRGYDLPPTIIVRGKKYRVTFTESQNFTEEVLD